MLGKIATSFTLFGLEMTKNPNLLLAPYIKANATRILGFTICNTSITFILNRTLAIQNTCHDLVSKKYSTQEIAVKFGGFVGFFFGIREIFKPYIPPS